jgi:hypothetical protein
MYSSFSTTSAWHSAVMILPMRLIPLSKSSSPARPNPTISALDPKPSRSTELSGLGRMPSTGWVSRRTAMSSRMPNSKSGGTVIDWTAKKPACWKKTSRSAGSASSAPPG